MTRDNKLVEKFQVEELESRYEMAWIDSVKVGGSYDTGHGTVAASVEFTV